MFKNYLKIVLRNLRKHHSFSIINIGGLAIGIAGCLLISLFIDDELNFDNMFPDADRIYRLNIDHRVGGETNKYAAVASPMAATLARDFSQIEMITRFRLVGSTLIRKPDAELNVKENHVVGADSAFFEMFGLDLIAGNAKTALTEPNALVLTKTAAEKHFGADEVLGQTLILNNKKACTITGVIDDLPKNSFLRDYHVFISISSFDDAESIAWNKWIFPTFVKLQPGANVEDLQAFLNTVMEKYLIPWAMTFMPGLTVEKSRAAEKETGNYMKFGAIPLTDIHLHSPDRKSEFNPNSSIQNVYILAFIGLFLILLACVNFMNLSTAHSLKRAKEVGIRKTLGSNRLSLIRQFLAESGLISLIALLAALLIAELIMPFFNELSGKAISMPFSNLVFWLFLIAATALLGLFSGSYPAFFMSKFLPVKVLKSGGQGSPEAGNVRSFLVVFQFAISIFLIAGTLVIFQQLQFIQNKDLGFQKDQILIVDDVEAAGNQSEAFKQNVEQLGQVERVSLSSFLPTPSARDGVTFFPEGRITETESALILQNWQVDHDYVSALDLEIIAGRDFNRQFSTDSGAIILNESAVAMLGLQPEAAPGMRLTKDFHRPDKENMEYFTIIGVVKNFHFESLRSDIGALSLTLGGTANRMIVKLHAGNFSNVIADIEQIWNSMAPGLPFNYYFMDDSFNDTYKAELRLGNIFITFTILSIVIAGLGLFGLAIFNAEKRTKEIGVRKVLGATVANVVTLLSRDFVKLVLAANFIAWPLAWYAMNKWLQNFAFRVEMEWWVFALAGGLALLIALLTVSTQAIKAALANPVEALRYE